jgi:non-heme chloroperoxidase
MMDGGAIRTMVCPCADAAVEREAMVRLPSGLRLHWIERGDPIGPPVLLLHGFTDSARSYGPLMSRMPGDWRCIALSQRGHGDSDRTAAGYRPADLAADLAAFAEALELGPALLVGHCMGGLVAQRFALDHEERVAGLALIGTLSSFRDNPAVEALRAVVSRLTDPIDPAFVRAFQESTLARPVPAWFLDQVVAESLKLPASVWKAALGGLLAELAPADLDRIAAPTLLIWGDHDGIVPRSGSDWLAGAIPGARLLVQAGSGHAPHWEDPAGVAEAIEAYFGGVVR